MNLELLQEAIKNHRSAFPGARPFLVMPAATKIELLKLYQTPAPEPWMLSSMIGHLLGIPIVLDNGCEVAWRLVDGRTGDVLVSDAS